MELEDEDGSVGKVGRKRQTTWTHQCSREVNACGTDICTIHPFWTPELPQSLVRHILLPSR
jgi:hypothetical protein